MNQVTTIEIPVDEAAAAALVDDRRRQAIGHLVDRLVCPGADDPLLPPLERTASEARDAGLTKAELAACNAE